MVDFVQRRREPVWVDVTAMPDSHVDSGERSFPRINYSAAPAIEQKIRSLGRTEDVSFSPSNKRMVIAGFARHRIAVFDVEIGTPGGAPTIALTGGIELSSPELVLPHGAVFLDDDTVAVASRSRDAALFRVPQGRPDLPSHQVAPMTTWAGGTQTRANVPGSVAAVEMAAGVHHLLVCNNAGHTVTRHVVDLGVAGATVRSDVLLGSWLDTPDGVAISRDGRWIAVSNHNMHNVLLYENSPSLESTRRPDGILRRIHYPHGLRFTPDGRHLFVADAGLPYLHVYERGEDGWRGVRSPLATIRVMDEEVFARGSRSPREGGPKGVAIDASGRILAVSSEHQPLAFFDLSMLLQHAASGTSDSERERLEAAYEACVLDNNRQKQEDLTETRTYVRYLKNSRSWRVTAPLRRLDALLRKRTP